jgi:hypothetical protein
VIEVGDHVQQLTVAVLGSSAIAKERPVDLLAVDRKGAMLGTVRTESAAVLVDVLVIGRLVHVPDAAVSIVLGVKRYWLGSLAKLH